MLEKKGIPGALFGVAAFKESAEGMAHRENIPLRITTIPYNYFGDTRERIYAEIKDSAPAMLDALIGALNDEEKKTGRHQVPEPSRIAFEGDLEDVQAFFIKNQWCDGLPVIPPTESRVAAMLKGTSRAPDEVVGLLCPEFWQVTVEKVAVNAVMAGCRPEYLPVVLAAVAGTIDKDPQSWIVSATSAVQMYLVNGPIRNEIGMNKGLGAQGPGNQANATIGRAVMLCFINLGGWWPGRNSLGTQGHPAQYTYCVPENEEDSPWEPFHEEKGYHADQSVLSMFVEYGGMCGGCEGMRETMPKSLSNIQRPFGATVLLDPSLAQIMNREGFTKQELQRWLWENTTETFEEWWQDPFLPNFIETYIGQPGYWPEKYKRGNLPPDAIVHKFPSPESINIIVIGGGAKVLYQTGGNKHRFSISIDEWR